MIDFLLILLLICVYFWILSSKDDENLFAKLILKKLAIFLDSIMFMILSKESKGLGPKYNPDPEEIKMVAVEKRTIVFIRHGESDWNNVFNKGINLSLFSRLFSALYTEFCVFASVNSIFIDSPLNFDGIEQAVELRHFIEGAHQNMKPSDPAYPIINVLQGKPGHNSIIVTSSLRRAIATTTLGLWSRVEHTKEKIHVLSSLQEISRNVDTYALSAKETVADLPFVRIVPHCGGEDKFDPTEVYDTSENYGNKTRTFYGIKRLHAFNEWVFQRKEGTIVVGGHSLWFKQFFRTFLPYKYDHDAKNKKIVNSGAVSFDLYYYKDKEGKNRYLVRPESIQTIYGGFTTK